MLFNDNLFHKSIHDQPRKNCIGYHNNGPLTSHEKKIFHSCNHVRCHPSGDGCCFHIFQCNSCDRWDVRDFKQTLSAYPFSVFVFFLRFLGIWIITSSFIQLTTGHLYYLTNSPSIFSQVLLMSITNDVPLTDVVNDALYTNMLAVRWQGCHLFWNWRHCSGSCLEEVGTSVCPGIVLRF